MASDAALSHLQAYRESTEQLSITIDERKPIRQSWEQTPGAGYLCRRASKTPAGPTPDTRQQGASLAVGARDDDGPLGEARTVPVPHMVHGMSSAPRGRCTAWGCTM